MLRVTIRVLAIAALLALVASTWAKADDQHKKPEGGHPNAAPHGPPPGPPHPQLKQVGPPHPAGPMGGQPHPQFKQVSPQHGPTGGPPPAAFVHPGPGPGGPAPAFAHGPHGPHGPPPGSPHFSFHGHDFNRVHVHPFIYPNGWAYREWAVGAILPPLFLAPDYYYPEWAQLGLEPPPPGDQWVRYGPDLLLVDMTTGQVIDVAYGVFYED